MHLDEPMFIINNECKHISVKSTANN